jgi:outer membrane protein assembly factor BamB
MGPAARSGALVAYDVASGAMKWTLPERPYSPAIDAQMGYVATASGVVTAVDLSTGRSVWSSAFAPPLRPPAVAGGLVLVAADGERSLLALDASTGATLWRHPMDGPNPCCIAVADGLVLAGTTSGSVFAIGGDGAPVRPQVSESPARSTPVPASATASASPSPSQSITPAPGGLATTLLWAVDGGIATFNPWALSQAPDGRLWASEGNADRFSIFTTDGDFVESWGVSGAGPGEFRLRRANGDPFGQIAFAADGSFFVLDPGNRRVQRFDRQRRFVREWDGAGSRSTRFVDPVGIAVDSLGHVSVLDDGRGVIETFAADGTVLKTIPAFGTRASGVANSLAVGPGGHFFVASADPNEVLELDANGTLIRTFGAAGSGEGALNEQPFGLAFDVAGHLYVTQGPGRGDRPGVLVFDAQGAYLGGFGPVGAGIDQLGFPWGIVVADDGIYVADAGSQPDVGFASFIRKFSPIRLR